MPRQRQPSWDDLSLFQKIETMQGLSFYPALSVICLFRRNVGYRMLNPGPLFAIAAIMFLLGEIARETPNARFVQLHAGIMLKVTHKPIAVMCSCHARPRVSRMMMTEIY